MIKIYIKHISGNEGLTRREAELSAVAECLSRAGLPTSLSHTETGAPFVAGVNAVCVSVSHSRHFAALAVGTDWDTPFGIDVEDFTRPQLARATRRLLSDDEFTRALNSDQGMIRAWTAKEAVYKAFARDNVDMRRDIVLTGETFDVALFIPENRSLKLAFRNIGHNNMLCLASERNKFEVITL